jgi:secreted Zn-dependent insulinase-like peptidase
VEVRDFHARHYSSNIMKGAVVGPQPLPELEALVRAKFDNVPNCDLSVPEFAGAQKMPQAPRLPSSAE